MIYQPSFFEVDPETVPVDVASKDLTEGKQPARSEGSASISDHDALMSEVAGVVLEEIDEASRFESGSCSSPHERPLVEGADGLIPSGLVVLGGAPCGSQKGKGREGGSTLPDSRWTPAPYALFASWSLPMQLTYCANRDEASAALEHDPEWAAFYLQRAADYRAEAGA